MEAVLETAVCAYGHVATTDELNRIGATPAHIRRGLHSGTIKRVARGVYACRHADRDQWDAAAMHARITCISALRRAGVWAGTDHSLHLQLSPHGAGARPAFTRTGRRIHLHWVRPRFSAGTSSWLAAPIDAVWQAIHCLDEEHAIACLESAAHEGYLTQQALRRVCARAPGRLQAGIKEMESTADSGQETIVRRRLRHVGYTVRAQERIPGLPYDQDLIVDDCVSIETDGRKWHGPERFEADRERDLHLEGMGRRALRLTNRAILDEWDTTLATIERAVADAKRDVMRRTGPVVVRLDDQL